MGTGEGLWGSGKLKALPERSWELEKGSREISKWWGKDSGHRGKAAGSCRGWRGALGRPGNWGRGSRCWKPEKGSRQIRKLRGRGSECWELKEGSRHWRKAAGLLESQRRAPGQLEKLQGLAAGTGSHRRAQAAVEIAGTAGDLRVPEKSSGQIRMLVGEGVQMPGARGGLWELDKNWGSCQGNCRGYVSWRGAPDAGSQRRIPGRSQERLQEWGRNWDRESRKDREDWEKRAEAGSMKAQ